MSNAKLLQAILNNQIDINAMRRSTHPFGLSEGHGRRANRLVKRRLRLVLPVWPVCGSRSAQPVLCGREPYLP